MTEILYCSAVCEHSLPDKGCCDSCHIDEDDYGTELFTIKITDEVSAHVCCRLTEWLEEDGGLEKLQQALKKEGTDR